ncbi:Hypothetical predicted protein [Pelobates cultripes]|uniref:Uncharacterized protein n=1 Tax=Pelobates cultripes TaxID=61616 RepID=A0AAD1WZD0_PELCU|nr:Hypothetical predicted protein [Pelobates cultripes]
MAPTSPAQEGPAASALERISEEIRTMMAAMATKADLLILTTTIQDALRAEMAGHQHGGDDTGRPHPGPGAR